MPVNPTPPENYRRTCLKWDGGWLEFDAVVRQQLEHDGEVTEHPIDEGADIVDHYRRFNIPLVLEAMITNSPLREPLTHTNGVTAVQDQRDVEIPAPIGVGPIQLPTTVFGFDAQARHTVTLSTRRFPDLDRVNAVYNELVAIQLEPRLVTVAFGDLYQVEGDSVDFDNLILKSFSVDREKRGTLPLVLEFHQVRFAELATETIEVRKPVKPRSNKNANAGKKPAAESKQRVSLLKRITSVGF